MAKTTIVHHPPENGVWPDGEPESVRKAADEKQAAEKPQS